MMHPILIIIIFIISFRIVQVFTFPNCLANIFSPTSNRLLFKRGPRLMFSKVLPTRPWPAFGRQGLDGTLVTTRLAPAALGSVGA